MRAFHDRLGVDLAIAEDRPMSKEVEAFCVASDIPFRMLRDGYDLADLMPGHTDLVMLSSFSTLLRQDVIDRCELILNFHGGIIEDCRGRHPLPSAILAGHAMMGVTCHVIDDENIDAGPLVAQLKLPIDYDASFEDNDRRLRLETENLVRLVADDYRHNEKLVTRSWTPREDSYFSPVSGKDMDRLFGAEKLRDLTE